MSNENLSIDVRLTAKEGSDIIDVVKESLAISRALGNETYVLLYSGTLAIRPDSNLQDLINIASLMNELQDLEKENDAFEKENERLKKLVHEHKK